MRITDGMMTNQVVFNMQRSLRRFMQMQTQMSSGRRINQPSDDPLGTQRDLSYRTELARIEQQRANISAGINWMNAYDSILSDAKDFVSRAKEIAINMADEEFDDQARIAAAREIDSMFEQLVTLGNKEVNGRRVFAGFKTKTQPLYNAANGVVYRGDEGRIEFEVESSKRMTINLTGSAVFLQPLQVLGDDADLSVAVTESTLVSDLRGSSGLTLGSIAISDINRELIPPVTIDLSGATTMGDAIATINSALSAGGLTNITARIGDEANNIVFETTANGKIATTTRLSDLNDGAGVDLSSGKIRLSNGAGIDVDVDLSGAETIDDVISMFNTQLDQADADLGGAGLSNVRLQLNADHTGLDIVDSNGTPLGLAVSDVGDTSFTARHLGLTGTVDPILNGDALNPVTRFEIAESGGTTAADLGILGQFTRMQVGGDLDPAMLNADPTSILLTDMNNGNGFSGGEIAIHHGNLTHIIDLDDPALMTLQDLLDQFNNSGLEITASLNAEADGIQITNNDPNRSLVIEDTGDKRAAKELGIFGAADVMGNFVALRNALNRDDQEGAGLLLESLDDSILHTLNHRATVGARQIRLETTERRLMDLDLNFTGQLSEVEDADITSLATDLATYENNYRASLISAAQIIQPSLLDFLNG
jgi:flagellar hook-associated protein 3